MIKRIIMLLTLTMISFILASCNLLDSDKDPVDNEQETETIEITDQLLLSNIEVFDDDDEINLNSVKTIDFGDLNLGLNYLNRGFYIVEDDESRQGVYSLITDKLIVPLQADVTFDVEYISYLGNYIYVNYGTGETAVYDINGYEVLEKDDYEIAEIKGRRESIYNDNNDYVGDAYYETVTRLLKTDYENGKEPISTVYEINVETKNRQVYQEDFFDWGESYNNEGYQENLEIIGLDGYYVRTNASSDRYLVYKEESDELVQTILIPTGVMGSAFGGHVFYQESYQVNDFDEDYSYMDEGKKYKLITASIDFLTGEETQYDVDYRINGFELFKDENGVFNNLFIKYNKITSKQLIKNREYHTLINSQGKIVADMNEYDLYSLMKLDDQHIYNEEMNVMLDDTFNEQFRIPNYDTTFIYSEKIIIVKENNLYGAVDYDGKVVIPFIYKEISTNFYNGRTYGVDQNDQIKLIDLNNATELVRDSFEYITEGLLFNYSDETGDNFLYEGKIINYEGNTIKAFDNLLFTTFNSYKVENIYGESIILQFQTDDGYEYVTIKLR